MADEKKQASVVPANVVAMGATFPDTRSRLLGGRFAGMMTQMVVANLMVKLREWKMGGKGLDVILEEIAREHIEMVMEASLQHRPEDVRHLLQQLPTDEARAEYLQKIDVCQYCGATPRSNACRGRGDV